MNNDIKPIGFRRNVDYIKVNIYFMYKKALEYKFNVYNVIFLQLFYVLCFGFFFTVISKNFGDIINWSIYDFLFYFFLTDTVWSLVGIIYWEKNLFFSIRIGLFNNYLTKPINPFIMFNFSNLSMPGIIMVLINMIYIIYYLFIKNIDLFSLLKGFLLFCMIVLLLLLFLLFFESFNLIKKGISEFINQVTFSFLGISHEYPYQFFKNIKYKMFLFFFPIFFVSSLIVPIFNSEIVENFYLQLYIILFLIIIYSLVIYFNWKIGLKKYEAYS